MTIYEPTSCAYPTAPGGESIAVSGPNECEARRELDRKLCDVYGKVPIDEYRKIECSVAETTGGTAKQ